MCVGGGSDRPFAAELEQLSLAPWKYVCFLMGLSQALAGVVASAVALGAVWPVRGPVALGGEV